MLSFYVLWEPNVVQNIIGGMTIYTLFVGIVLEMGDYPFAWAICTFMHSILCILLGGVAKSSDMILRLGLLISLVFLMEKLASDFAEVVSEPVPVTALNLYNNGHDLCPEMDFYSVEDLEQLCAAVLFFTWILVILILS